MDDDKRGKLILLSDLDTDTARAAAGRAIAAIEEDCSASWPACPRGGLLCDCRLRAVRALNAVRLYLGSTTGSELERAAGRER